MSEQDRRDQYRQELERLNEFRRRNYHEQNGFSSSSPGGNSSGGTERTSFGSNSENQPVNDALIPQHIYSPSGFDILSILMRVRSRPNPIIKLGNVDTSVALVLCDADTYDCPIVYCSEHFERLTGYPQHEIIGKNCRFLQIPPHNTRASIRQSILAENERALKGFRIKLQRQEEAQVKLVNFKRDGARFENILTTIPIVWNAEGDTGPARRYVVGFQVDKEKGLFG